MFSSHQSHVELVTAPDHTCHHLSPWFQTQKKTQISQGHIKMTCFEPVPMPIIPGTKKLSGRKPRTTRTPRIQPEGLDRRPGYKAVKAMMDRECLKVLHPFCYLQIIDGDPDKLVIHSHKSLLFQYQRWYFWEIGKDHYLVRYPFLNAWLHDDEKRQIEVMEKMPSPQYNPDSPRGRPPTPPPSASELKKQLMDFELRTIDLLFVDKSTKGFNRFF